MGANIILVIITDLMFQSRVQEQARAQGYNVVVAESTDAAYSAIATRPSIVVLDLHADGIDWRGAVALAKERRVPVLAFGRHTEAQLLRSAREAGCDRVVPRSTFVEELPQLILELAVLSQRDGAQAKQPVEAAADPPSGDAPPEREPGP